MYAVLYMTLNYILYEKSMISNIINFLISIEIYCEHNMRFNIMNVAEYNLDNKQKII